MRTWIIGIELRGYDGFFDEYVQEELVCSDILDLIGACDTPSIKVEIDRDFLLRLAKSHMAHLRKLRKP